MTRSRGLPQPLAPPPSSLSFLRPPAFSETCVPFDLGVLREVAYCQLRIGRDLFYFSFLCGGSYQLRSLRNFVWRTLLHRYGGNPSNASRLVEKYWLTAQR